MVQSLVDNYPTERAIYFLRNNSTTAKMAGYPTDVQEAEATFWHIVTHEAAIRDFGGVARSVAVESAFLRAVDGSSFDQAISAVKAAAAKPTRITVP